MSKINLILAIMLTAFVLCLAACGENKDAAATPSQSSPERSSSQVQNTSSAGGDPVRSDSGTSSEGSDANADRQDAVDGGGEQSAQISDEGASAQNNADGTGSQENDKTGTDSGTSQKDTHQDSVPDTVKQPAPVYQKPTEIDNAKVNFDDL